MGKKGHPARPHRKAFSPCAPASSPPWERTPSHGKTASEQWFLLPSLTLFRKRSSWCSLPRGCFVCRSNRLLNCTLECRHKASWTDTIQSRWADWTNTLFGRRSGGGGEGNTRTLQSLSKAILSHMCRLICQKYKAGQQKGTINDKQ